MKKLSKQAAENAASYLSLALGMCCYALALNLFLADNNIAAGGVEGIAIVISNFLPLSIGTLTFILNIPILIFSLKMNGLRYTLGALIGAACTAILIDWFAVLPCLTTDPLVASVFGGAIYGLGMASFTRCGGSNGGTDLLNRTLLKLFPTMSIGKMSIILDGSVVLLAIIVLKNIEVGLYAIITLGVCSMTADTIILGYDKGIISLVITARDPDELARPLMETTGRAVTNLKGTGMYSHTDRNVLLMGVRNREVHKVKSLVKELDPDAFVILITARELIGGRFRGAWLKSLAGGIQPGRTVPAETKPPRTKKK